MSSKVKSATQLRTTQDNVCKITSKIKSKLLKKSNQTLTQMKLKSVSVR